MSRQHSNKRSISLNQKTKNTNIPLYYKKQRKIGTGFTSSVYTATHQQYGNVCIKVVNHRFLKTKLGAKLIQNQILLLKNLEHQNLVKFITSQDVGESKIIVTQYCEKGDLEKRLKMTGKFSQIKSLRYLQRIVEGCIYLNNNNILHRDLKPSNIFLTRNSLKIGDFGFAVHTENKFLMKQNVGSPFYMAPQTLAEGSFTQKSEVFGIGIILYEFLTGKTPWKTNSQRDLLNKIKTQQPDKIKGLKLNTEQILSKCLQIQSSNRITLNQLSKLIQKSLFKANVQRIQIFSQNSQQNIDFNCIEKSLNKQERQRNATILTSRFNKFNTKVSSKQKQPEEAKRNSIMYKNPAFLPPKPPKQHGKRFKTYSTKQSDTLPVIQTIYTKQDQKQLTIIDIIREIKPKKMTYLSQILIQKLDFILKKYTSIKINSDTKIGQMPRIRRQLTEDQLIIDVIESKTERQLCKSIAAFMKRLIRLQRHYKQKKQDRRQIELFYEHIIRTAS